MMRWVVTAAVVLIVARVMLVRRRGYVYVDDDGTVRRLTPDEERYLATAFHPSDGGRPHIKATYKSRTPDGHLRGFLELRDLPPWVRVRG